MMRVFRFLLLLILSMSWGLALCFNNSESVTSLQETQTKQMLIGQKINLISSIDTYKEALEKKKKMIMALWKTVAKVEFLMKENQVLRKEMIKYWEDVKQSHTNVQSL